MQGIAIHLARAVNVVITYVVDPAFGTFTIFIFCFKIFDLTCLVGFINETPDTTRRCYLPRKETWAKIPQSFSLICTR